MVLGIPPVTVVVSVEVLVLAEEISVEPSQY
jgi:hypothetical protein